MVLKLLSRKHKPADGGAAPVATVRRPPPLPPNPAAPFEPGESVQLDADDLKRHLQLGRFAVVTRNPERWQNHPHIRAARKMAAEAIDEIFSLVPEGHASIPQTVSDAPGCPEIDVETGAFLLAKHAVTNAQYQMFVDSGAYEDTSVWAKDIWPHLIDFKDLTDQPGPRFWQNGKHNKALAAHPVVGVCHYEAAAYAKWAGYRLPTEAEWQVAASWRIRSSAHVLRRYPWGDALDRSRCNIWATGVGGTAPVTEYKEGAAPNGVLQLVGNVWEWTASDFEVTDDQGRPVVGDMLMKSVRGGAYDTYFPAQATSCFRTGLASLVRAHNTGVRCALDPGGARPGRE